MAAVSPLAPLRRPRRGRRLLSVAMVVLGALIAPVMAAAESPVSASRPTVLSNGTIRVAFTANAAGTAAVSSARLATSNVGVLCAAQATVVAAEEKVLLCVPTQTAQKLRRFGAVRVRVTLAFTTADGSTSTTRLGAVVLPRLAAPDPSGTTPVVTG